MAGSVPEATSGARSAGGRRSAARAGLLVGFAFGVDAAAGTALLLYTGQGFLRAAGLLAAMAVGALTAGLWAGAAPGPSLRSRWVGAFLLYLAAAAATLAWAALPALRAVPLADGLAMLLIIALPAYGTGLLLAGMGERGRRPGVPAMAGAAAGILLAGGTLIPRLDAPLVFALAAGVVLTALALDWRSAATVGGEMAGDVVIVSGAGSRGQLAFSIAQRLHADGARIVLTARTGDVAQLARELGDDTRAIAVPADLLVEADAARVVDAALAHFGRIDALVNAAGGLSHSGRVEDTDPAALRAELDRNLVTAHILSRAALPALRESRGAIINFASPAALRAPAALAAYSAAKAGVVAFTRALALEEKAHGVRVNALAPGAMDTAQNRASAEAGTRFVARADVAEVVRFLVSRESRAITGETIQVTGL